MPPFRVRLADSAIGDLQALTDWYGTQGVPEVGARIVGEIVDRIEMLSDHPDLGRIVPEFGQPTLRELIHPPFRIVYRRDREAVQIVRVWRSERLLELPQGGES